MENSLLLHFKDFALSNENKNLELTGSNALKLELSYKNESKEFYIFEYNKPIMIELADQNSLFLGRFLMNNCLLIFI